MIAKGVSCFGFFIIHKGIANQNITDKMQPRILWAQDTESVFLTIEVLGCQNARLDTFEDIEKGTTLLCIDDNDELHIRLDLCKSIISDQSELKQTPRNIQIILVKSNSEIWERLLFDKSSYSNLAVDWDKWAAAESDDDEQDFQSMMPPGFDMSSIADMTSENELPHDENNAHEDETLPHETANLDSL